MWRWTRRLLIGAGGLVCVLGLAGVALIAFGRPRVGVGPSTSGLADLHVDGFDTHVSQVHATLGSRPIRISVENGRLVPSGDLPSGATVEIGATATAPTWLTWLLGAPSTSSVAVLTPQARPESRLVLAPAQTPVSRVSLAATSRREVAVRFTAPISVVAYRPGGPDTTTRLVPVQPPSAVAEVPVPADAAGGTFEVSGVARPWETVPPADHRVVWVSVTKGGPPVVIAEPGPGGTASTSTTPIRLDFSEPVAAALGQSRPEISPAVQGTWSEPTNHELVFTPSGFGYGPGAMVTVGFERPIGIVSNGITTNAASRAISAAGSSFSFTVQPGSVLRLDQILAQLHYLPLRFTPAAGTPVPTTMAAEEATIYSPLAGSFSWRYPDIPPTLAAQWSPGQPTVMVKGALMAFEAASGTYDYTIDGESVAAIADASTWKALLAAALAGKVDPNPYSYVSVTKTLPETLTLWENGQVVLTSPTNTGIPQDPTADGTYPIYLRFVEHYMNGTNPNGTRYHDLVHWINYFNGGDAVHGFVRAAYGFPQSLGCCELPVATAAEVFPHLAIGDLVTVSH